MAASLFEIVVDGCILAGVVAAFMLSLRMTITAKTKTSLQFQLSAWLIIWTVSEIWRYLNTLDVVTLSPSAFILGTQIHTVSMIAFAGFIWYRFSKFIRR